jgi:hypothetical protein
MPELYACRPLCRLTQTPNIAHRGTAVFAKERIISTLSGARRLSVWIGLDWIESSRGCAALRAIANSRVLLSVYYNDSTRLE